MKSKKRESKIQLYRIRVEKLRQETEKIFRFVRDCEDVSIRRITRRHAKLDNKQLNKQRDELIQSVVAKSADLGMMLSFFEENPRIAKKYNKFVKEILPEPGDQNE